MKPHERLFVAMGFLTLIIIGASMPIDPEVDGTRDTMDWVFVGLLIAGCVYVALRAFLDMAYKRPRRTPPTYHRRHHKRL